MSKIAVSAFIAAPSILAGSLFLASTHNVRHLDYRLVDEALVIIPVDNPAYADAAADLYLHAAGFEVTPDYANVATLNIPEVVPGGGLDNAVDYGVNQLVTTVENDYQTRCFRRRQPALHLRLFAELGRGRHGRAAAICRQASRAQICTSSWWVTALRPKAGS